MELFQRYPIESLAIFGSYSRNEQSENSDVDVLVDFNDKVGSLFIKLGDELENLLGVKVDLVSRKGIKDGYFDAIKSDLKYV
jgi:predicted nucleotidyltransferase